MSIESKIRVKAIAVYVIVAIAMVAMIVYSYKAKRRVAENREKLEKQYKSLDLTNRLIFFVQNTQELENKFISVSNNKKSKIIPPGSNNLKTNNITPPDGDVISAMAEVEDNIEAVKIIADTIAALHPAEKENLQKICTLLYQQLENFSKLNAQLTESNPVSRISERIKNFEPHIKDTAVVSTIIKDTVIKYPVKRKFLQRVGDLFKAHKDSIVTTVVRETDTIRRNVTDTLPIISEVGKIARRATRDYDINIRSISKQVSNLIMADRALSAEITQLLLVLHGKMIDSAMTATDKNESEIEINYILSLAGGLGSLLLALFLIIMILADITRGQRARAELERANRQIRNIMESRHRLLLAVSHDIKSPLGSISGYLNIIQNNNGEDRSIDEYLNSMKNSVRHITALLNNLLEFSSIEQGEEKINRETINIPELAAEIMGMFEPLAKAKGIEIKVNNDNCRVDGDLMKTKQIIINLVSNAVKYTAKGTIRLEIKYSAGNMIINVEDTGTGIPPQNLNDIYKPFTRIDNNSAMASGTGLGMYVVKGILEMLNGKIEVSSELGKGTVFSVTFPVELHDKSSDNNGKQPAGPKKIVIFDDDPSMEQVVKLMLERLGHSIVEEDYDVILTDMEMCDLSGMDVLASSPDIPVVIMTGRSDFSREEALKLGFADYLAKPFTFDSLMKIFGNYGTDKKSRVEKSDSSVLWDNDNQEIVKALFYNSVKENSIKLRSALKENNFTKAQFISHKMLPMFAQMGYTTEALRRLDMHRGTEYEGWQSDVESVLSIEIKK